MPAHPIYFEQSSGDNCSAKFSNNIRLDKVSSTLLERIHCQKNKPDLDLSLCTLSQVPVDAILFYYGAVKSLDLSYNSIGLLSQQFALKLTTLTKLDLSRNELKRLPDNFGLLEHLIYLDLHKNQLQTLPLSMGKMVRLQYLNILNNPFRSPLCNFVRLHTNRDLGGVDAANLVIKFLAKLSEEARARACGDAVPTLTSRVPSPQNTVLNGNRRGVTFELETDEEVSPAQAQSGSGIFNQEPPWNSRQQKLIEPIRCPAETSLSYAVEDKGYFSETSVVELRVLGLMMLFFVVVLFPLLMATFCETSYLDSKVVNHRRWTYAWKEYKPYHVIAERAVKSQRFRDILFYLHGPPGASTEDYGNFMQIGYRKIINAFSYMLSYIWGEGTGISIRIIHEPTPDSYF